MFLWDPRRAFGFGKRALAQACAGRKGKGGGAGESAGRPNGTCDHVMTEVEELQISSYSGYPYHVACPGLSPSAGWPGQRQESFGRQHVGGFLENGYIPNQTLPFGTTAAAAAAALSRPNESSIMMDVDDGINAPFPIAAANDGNLKRRASPDPDQDTRMVHMVGVCGEVGAAAAGVGRRKSVSIFALEPREARAAKLAAWRRLSADLGVHLPENVIFDAEAEAETGLPKESNVFGRNSSGGICRVKWSRGSKTPLEGTPLFSMELCALNKATGVWWGPAKIPAVCKHIVDYLVEHDAFEKEGIFRVGGAEFRSRAIVRDINAGVYAGGFAGLDGKPIERGGCVSPPGRPDMAPAVMEMAGLLKQFLRDLPEPIIPAHLDTVGRVIVERHNPALPERSVAALRDMIVLLPVASRDMLAFVLDVARRTVISSAANLMVSENVARVIGPNLVKVELPASLPAAAAAALAGLAPHHGGRGRPAASAAAAGLDAFGWVVTWFKLCLDHVHLRADGVPSDTAGMSDGSVLFSTTAPTEGQGCGGGGGGSGSGSGRFDDGDDEDDNGNGDDDGDDEYNELWEATGECGYSFPTRLPELPPEKKPQRFNQKWKKMWKRI